ncbi:response regulator [Ponticaulis sp.]|uniref:response regulator transcription factor n=1 Tax=Ponticaulis sp. TaxID=2020902 RepID=UPI000C3FFC3F|nr:response regulator [Ponticaulis sp.]MBN03324.1 hypothetical protein [Ponticaulis sp.]|tara:strand:+ start:864 stop:1634 length:771 start_codon:yes stop_codon:yes gene_type:complete
MYLKILIADDEPEIRRLIFNLIWKDSYHRYLKDCSILEADSSEVAFKLVKSEAPDICVFDLNFSIDDVQSGLNLVERTRRISDAMIIVLTSHESEAFANEALERGADYYIEKNDRAFNERSMLMSVLNNFAKKTLRHRHKNAEEAAPQQYDVKMVLGDYTFRRGISLLVGSNDNIPLSPLEYAFFDAILIHDAHQVDVSVMNATLYEETHSKSPLKNLVSRLRKKIPDGIYIRTVRSQNLQAYFIEGAEFIEEAAP